MNLEKFAYSVAAVVAGLYVYNNFVSPMMGAPVSK